MKQTVLMILLLSLGTGGTLLMGPFVGLAVYYLFAVLRPQYIWEWALLLDLRWSLYVAVATLVAMVLYQPFQRGGRAFSWGHAAMLGFILWVTLSHIYAFDPVVSAPWYWEYFKVSVMFFCGSLIVRDFIQVRTLYLIAVFAIAYIAYEMNFLYLVNRRLDIFHGGYGGLDNNGAGLLMAMGVPMAYFLWQGYRRWWRWAFLGMVPLMLHALLMSYSRGAMVSLLLASPLLVVRSPRRIGMVLSMAGFALLLPILAGPEIQAEFFSVAEYEEDGSSQSRLESWEAGWGIAKNHPILGTGLRNADLLSYQYGADRPGRTIHSQYLQIAADSGFPAMGLYLLVVFAVWRALRATQKRYGGSAADNHRLAYGLASGIEGALAVFLIGSAFLSLEVFEPPYLLILLALKLPLSRVEEERTPSTPSRWTSRLSVQPENELKS